MRNSYPRWGSAPVGAPAPQAPPPAQPSPPPAMSQGYRQQQNQPVQNQGYRQPQHQQAPVPFHPNQRPVPQQAPQSQVPQQSNRPQPPQQYESTRNAPSAPPAQANMISQKCAKVNGKDKVIDFTGNLSMANLEDFAMVHGCGGKSHARNSTISAAICDYTKGTGEASVTVRFGIDVEDCTILYNAAMYARLGLLPVYNPGTPAFQYSKEKNNPYAIKNGYAPCSRITISFTPIRQDGQRSSYPWYVCIENFDAPIQAKQNGATAHNSKQAINKRSAFINLSADDFAASMVAVDRFVRLWEHRMLPVMEEAYRILEVQKQQRRTEQNNNQPAPARQTSQPPASYDRPQRYGA